jgi:hypothetical protein
MDLNEKGNNLLNTFCMRIGHNSKLNGPRNT